MAKFDELYEFRLASLDDVDAIMTFFKEEWSSTHILANDKEFFLYEFAHGDNLNFLLAINKKTGKIDVTYGFIQYTEKIIPGVTDIFGAMFKARPTCGVPMIGTEAIKRLKDFVPYRSWVGNGVNTKTAMPIHKRIMKHYSGRLQQFYLLNKKEQYNVAEINHSVDNSILTTTQKEMKEYTTSAELFQEFHPEDYKTQFPYKDAWYIDRRYFKHPIYIYRVWMVNDDKSSCVIVGREISVNDSKILRIVDILGDYTQFAFTGDALKKLLVDNNYEYIDFYEHGIPDEVMKRAGMTERLEDDTNIIPNYFEPFLRKNIEIWYAATNAEMIITKADGDQDRPNHR